MSFWRFKLHGGIVRTWPAIFLLYETPSTLGGIASGTVCYLWSRRLSNPVFKLYAYTLPPFAEHIFRIYRVKPGFIIFCHLTLTLKFLGTIRLVNCNNNNNQRPDGLSLVPWWAGKPLTWDVTAVALWRTSMWNRRRGKLELQLSRQQLGKLKNI